MRININKDKIDKLSPEDAIPLVLKIRRLVLGKAKPDLFTRIVFVTNFFAWVLLMAWNLISYGVVLMSDFIKVNKGFSVNAILRAKGEEMGIQGQVFLDTIRTYYFLNIVIWFVIFIGLVLLYRKSKFYAGFYFGGFIIHFSLLLLMLGPQYFAEHVSNFDKMLYAILLLSAFVHYTLLMKEKRAMEEVQN